MKRHSRSVVCEKCESTEVGTLHSYLLDDLSVVRRRHCRDCGHRWYGYQEPEVVVDSTDLVWGRNPGGIKSRVVDIYINRRIRQ